MLEIRKLAEVFVLQVTIDVKAINLKSSLGSHNSVFIFHRPNSNGSIQNTRNHGTAIMGPSYGMAFLCEYRNNSLEHNLISED